MAQGGLATRVTFSLDDTDTVNELEEMLQRLQELAPKYIDFTADLLRCTSDDVFRELNKAIGKMALGTSPQGGIVPVVSILNPGLAALPDRIGPAINGGLAALFCVRTSPCPSMRVSKCSLTIEIDSWRAIAN